MSKNRCAVCGCDMGPGGSGDGFTRPKTTCKRCFDEAKARAKKEIMLQRIEEDDVVA